MVRFINAAESDFEAAFRFIRQLWSYNSYDRTIVREVYRRVLQNPDSFAFFALDEAGEAVGFCHGDYFDTFWMSGRTCYISSLITDEKHRNRGCGTAMLDHARGLALQRGCRAVILDSGFPRQEAHRFYEHYGFEKSCFGFEMSLL